MNLGKKLAEGFAVDSEVGSEIAGAQTGPMEIVAELPAPVQVEAPAEPATV